MNNQMRAATDAFRTNNKGCQTFIALDKDTSGWQADLLVLTTSGPCSEQGRAHTVAGRKPSTRITCYRSGQVEAVSGFTGECAGHEERKCIILVLTLREGRAKQQGRKRALGGGRRIGVLVVW